MFQHFPVASPGEWIGKIYVVQKVDSQLFFYSAFVLHMKVIWQEGDFSRQEFSYDYFSCEKTVTKLNVDNIGHQTSTFEIFSNLQYIFRQQCYPYQER